MAQATAGVWTHVAVVRAGESQSMYINGELADNAASPAAAVVDASPYDLMLGNQSDGDSRWFMGMMDEIRMLDRANTASWIKLCYENQKPGQLFVQVQMIQ